MILPEDGEESSSKDLTNREVLLSLTSVLTHPEKASTFARGTLACSWAVLPLVKREEKRKKVRALQDVARFLERRLHAGNRRKA